jgi:hypothetical protein
LNPLIRPCLKKQQIFASSVLGRQAIFVSFFLIIIFCQVYLQEVLHRHIHNSTLGLKPFNYLSFCKWNKLNAASTDKWFLWWQPQLSILAVSIIQKYHKRQAVQIWTCFRFAFYGNYLCFLLVKKKEILVWVFFYGSCFNTNFFHVFWNIFLNVKFLRWLIFGWL